MDAGNFIKNGIYTTYIQDILMNERPVILAVDDNPTNIKLLEGHLRKEYEFLSSSNGVDAVEICNTSHVDLVLLDVMMPDIDGYEVCKCLKEYENTRNIRKYSA